MTHPDRGCGATRPSEAREASTAARRWEASRSVRRRGREERRERKEGRRCEIDEEKDRSVWRRQSRDIDTLFCDKRMVLDKETSLGGTKRAGRVPVRLDAARLNRVPCGDERRQVCSQRLVFFCIRILVYAPWHLADFFASFPLQTDVPVSLRDSAAQEMEAWRAARCCERGGDVDGGVDVGRRNRRRPHAGAAATTQPRPLQLASGMLLLNAFALSLCFSSVRAQQRGSG